MKSRLYAFIKANSPAALTNGSKSHRHQIKLAGIGTFSPSIDCNGNYNDDVQYKAIRDQAHPDDPLEL